MLHLDAQVLGIASPAAQEHLVRRVVVVLDPAVCARDERVLLPAQAQVEGQVLVDLPAVAEVEAILPFTAGLELGLQALARLRIQPEQELGIGVELVW